MTKATDGTEAKAAVERSARRLEEAELQATRARGLVAKLIPHLERNHFSDRLDEAFGRENRP